LVEDSNLEDVREFVRRHRVCFETYPIIAVRRGTRIQVGFELELGAMMPESLGEPLRDRRLCQRLFDGLCDLARAVISGAYPGIRFEIGPCDSALRYSGSPGLHPEVLLRLRILHRKNYFDPLDEEETRCLFDTERALRQLGVRSGRR